MTAEVYYPPQGVYFRLYNPSLDRFIYAREKWDDTGTVPSGGEAYADQWFTFADCFAGDRHLKNKIGRLLACEPNVSKRIISDDSSQSGCSAAWKVDLEPAKDIDGKSCFRLIFLNHYGYTKQSLRGNSDGIWRVEPSGFHVNENEQLWQMAFDDMELEEVKWDTKNMITNTKPEILKSYEFPNDNSKPVKHVISVNEKVSHKSQFSKKAGVNFKTVIAEKVSFPAVAEESVQFEFGGSVDVTNGTEDEWSKTYEDSTTFEVEEFTFVKATYMVTKGTYNIPYTLVFFSPSTRQRMEMSGTWKGVSTYNLNFRTELIKRYPPRGDA